jgi:5-methyltetrahydrofolate--homocysteine methyltransferase
MEAVKRELGVCTVLGVSNVSFGLPRRILLNLTFLAMALAKGLDAPIINPLSEDMMDTIRSFRVLANQDAESKEFVTAYAGARPKKAGKKTTSEKSLGEIIESGMKAQSAGRTREMLEDVPPMEIVERHLIPALDSVGRKYEKGEIFLPQLIQAAETVKAAFEEIKKKLAAEDRDDISKGRVLLATVRGDVHDIGKNIVKILLENYGYEVVDLGKDVAIDEVVRAAKEKDIKLVGLSALMTTTVQSMEETIAALRGASIPCMVVVGGAVVTKEYAEKMGADYYARDAREAVEVAKTVFKA